MDLDAVRQQIAGIVDPRMREVNARHGDAHGANLTALRALAKRLKTNQELAIALWATGDADAQLLALLICKPKAFSADALDAMVREIRYPKVLDWFVNVVKASKHAETLRLRWKDAAEELVGRAGWSLTTDRVVKSPAQDEVALRAPDGLDLVGLLDQIEAEMKSAPERKQWSMNHCLAEIGIRNPELRARAIAIGERLQVLADYPASPGCTPPYAPVWIAEMVRRREA